MRRSSRGGRRHRRAGRVLALPWPLRCLVRGLAGCSWAGRDVAPWLGRLARSLGLGTERRRRAGRILVQVIRRLTWCPVRRAAWGVRASRCRWAVRSGRFRTRPPGSLATVCRRHRAVLRTGRDSSRCGSAGVRAARGTAGRGRGVREACRGRRRGRALRVHGRGRVGPKAGKPWPVVGGTRRGTRTTASIGADPITNIRTVALSRTTLPGTVVGRQRATFEATPRRHRAPVSPTPRRHRSRIGPATRRHTATVRTVAPGHHPRVGPPVLRSRTPPVAAVPPARTGPVAPTPGRRPRLKRLPPSPRSLGITRAARTHRTGTLTRPRIPRTPSPTRMGTRRPPPLRRPTVRRRAGHPRCAPRIPRTRSTGRTSPVRPTGPIPRTLRTGRPGLTGNRSTARRRPPS